MVKRALSEQNAESTVATLVEALFCLRRLHRLSTIPIALTDCDLAGSIVCNEKAVFRWTADGNVLDRQELQRSAAILTSIFVYCPALLQSDDCARQVR